MATQSELTDLFEYGIDTENRRIYFSHMAPDAESSTDVTQTSIEIAVRALHKMASDAPNKPIELHVNSFGGSVYDAFRLYDEILCCSAQVKFYGGGAIMSAATIIMLACDERYLHQNATVMIHELSSSSNGKHTDMQVSAIEDKRLMRIIYKMYEDNTKMPVDFWEDVCQRDLYLMSSEAVSLGLADKVIEPKKRGNLRKMRYAAMKKQLESKDMNGLIKDLYERINKKKVPKIELNEVKKEEADPNVIVETLQKQEVPPSN